VNATAVGRQLLDATRLPANSDFTRAAGSTDMGNVSLKIPSIHPMIGLSSMPAVNHQPEFTAHCIKTEADRAVFDGALAMAWTMIDAATNVSLRDRLIRGIGASQ
jgi:metal-dependent amidase/aminoacylase/carboxypeptidase family protein